MKLREFIILCKLWQVILDFEMGTSSQINNDTIASFSLSLREYLFGSSNQQSNIDRYVYYALPETQKT